MAYVLVHHVAVQPTYPCLFLYYKIKMELSWRVWPLESIEAILSMEKNAGIRTPLIS
jgi:hypothetical protein